MNNSRFWRRDVVFCRFRRPSPMFVTYFQTKHVHSEISHIKRIILQYFHMAYIIDTIAIFICFPRLGRSTARERLLIFRQYTEVCWISTEFSLSAISTEILLITGVQTREWTGTRQLDCFVLFEALRCRERVIYNWFRLADNKWATTCTRVISKKKKTRKHYSAAIYTQDFSIVFPNKSECSRFETIPRTRTQTLWL